MRRRWLFLTTLAAAFVGVGCATTAPPYNPFKVAQDDFYGKVKTVALAPVSIPGDLDDPDPVKAKFESLIEGKLREAGLSVIPSKEGEEIWKQMKEHLGGFFDPITGKRDEAKFKAAREYTLRELHTKFKADAVLHPRIQVVGAPWSGGTATWGGTTESIRSTGEMIVEALPLALLGVGVTRHGSVPALSLVVVIEDIHGIDMYVNGGGIQVLSKISGGKFSPVPRPELFANEERNVAAVNIALGPLVTKSTPAGPPKEKP